MALQGQGRTVLYNASPYLPSLAPLTLTRLVKIGHQSLDTLPSVPWSSAVGYGRELSPSTSKKGKVNHAPQ